ncbi:MAG TPA: glutamate-1-semialdehyde 2,1-aminomutase [Syntrophales bacterium]|nr:glutamate-1-semialdehyde 2,1-aminomutase [Syntrophales bacterium]HOX95158.1 glutamate-1-semialdehyde 2,1-aminomutase [Syntrophales bacterium]HPI58347.1 glutamate-1-semialdehyde 2,1-aminomutase [Syntrophales bacterium]HPN26198.1 glutamate-1-semialdehyde 2,1-aminomutase [Syntrophales bacterium]HQM30591.1 glutamate-1-semialdehyde 2,1-aminomutase [Syntrophales bacterium]
MRKRSEKLFEKAKRFIPGGVNSPVRAFRSVEASPLFIARAAGSKVFDTDGHEYIDYVSSWGPMILGHGHPAVVQAISRAARKGTSYGAPTEMEVRMAEMIRRAIPSVEMVRMVSSGTEAVMSAIRLARGYTGRERIIKFEGCYHGHADSLLVKAGSGVATLGIPGSPGVPAKLAELTINVPFNDAAAVRSAVDRLGDEIACVIVEPVAGNMGVVPPRPGFLETLRKITESRGIVLIFDEVITGFRFTYGGYQNLIGIEPDLTCLGKIIGGGLPVGAFGGKKKIMEMLAPLGPVYQAGTLSGNPLAMAAGVATLKLLRDDRTLYERIDGTAATLCGEMKRLFSEKGLPAFFHRAGSMFTAFFTRLEVFDFATASTSDTKLFARFFRGMLSRGVYLAPSQFEAAFISAAHGHDDIDRTLSACAETLREF